MIKITIADVPPSLNQIIKMSKQGWQVYYKAKKQWTEDISWLAKEKAQELDEAPIDKPVTIIYKYYFPTAHKRDPDNFAAGAKFLLDGLVEGGLLEDDDFEHIPNLKMDTPEIDRDNPRTEIIIMD